VENSVPSGESRLERDAMDEFIDRSLQSLDSILDGCLESIASGGKTDQMIDESLIYLHEVTSGSQYNDQPQQQDVVPREDVSNEESWVLAPSNRLTDDRQRQSDEDADCQPQG